MNWGLELGPKTSGFKAPVRLSPSLDFVLPPSENGKVEPEGEKDKTEKEGQRLKFYSLTFEKDFAIQLPELTTDTVSQICAALAASN